MDNAPMMKCGHTANSYTYNKKGERIVACAICGCTEVADNKPLLKGRVARCSECGRLADSNWDLPFFRYGGEKNTDGLAYTDTYYCGCHGWD